MRGEYVLEFGCGSGLNCAYLSEKTQLRHISGFDRCSDAVALARSQFPHRHFMVADGCDPNLSIAPNSWGVVFSTEVLEHVPDMPAFLRNMKRHMRPNGVAFITTPNRDVFSCGHEPSPINREHIKESNLSELKELLAPHFASVEIYGQRFKDRRRRAEWRDSTLLKIEQLKSGTRWDRKPETIVDRLKWRLLPQKGPYRWDDFEFTKDLDDALWFCVIAR
jgi:SAM-dependent methyltransferase